MYHGVLMKVASEFVAQPTGLKVPAGISWPSDLGLHLVVCCWTVTAVTWNRRVARSSSRTGNVKLARATDGITLWSASVSQ